MEIKKITQYSPEIIKQIAEIHIKTFKGFFLTFMGAGFLRQMYKAYVFHQESELFLASEDNKVVGFVAYTENLSGLYKHMIKNQLIQFGWYSAGAFFRKPKVFMRLIRAFLKPSESKRTEKYAEITSIGVHPDVKGIGIGSQLISEVKKFFAASACEYLSLETDAVNNEGANAFYVKNGFVLAREYKTHEGRSMNEYRWTNEGE